MIEGVIEDANVYWVTPPGEYTDDALTQAVRKSLASDLWLHQGSGWYDAGPTPLCVDVTERFNDCYDCLLIETFRMHSVGEPLECTPTPPDPVGADTNTHCPTGPKCSDIGDIAGPAGLPDCKVDMLDFAVLSSDWLADTSL